MSLNIQVVEGVASIRLCNLMGLLRLEPALNFIPGTNVTISCADGTSVTNCTFNSTASGMVYPSGSGFAVVSGGTI